MCGNKQQGNAHSKGSNSSSKQEAQKQPEERFVYGGEEVSQEVFVELPPELQKEIRMQMCHASKHASKNIKTGNTSQNTKKRKLQQTGNIASFFTTPTL